MSTQPAETLAGHCTDCRRALTEEERTQLAGRCSECASPHGTPPRRPAYDDGTPRDGLGRKIVNFEHRQENVDPAMINQGPDAIAAALEERDSHRYGCSDAACVRCNSVNDRLLRGDHSSSGGGGEGGKRRRKPNPPRDHTKSNIVELEMRDLRPCPVAGRVSVEARDGLYADGNPSPGEMLDVIGRALRRGVAWTRIQNLVDAL